jgi:DNA polymerase-3 subunit alpha
VIGFYLSGHPLDRYKLVIEKISNCKTTTLENKRDQQVKLAGIVTQTRERIAKNGNPYGNFTIQDYEGSVSFALFNEDYRKFQSYLTLNSLVLLVGQYRPRFNGGDYEFRLTDVKLLETIFEQSAKEIVIKLGLPEILNETPQRLLELVEPFRAERGCFLKFEVLDPETQRKVSLLSSNIRLRPEVELLNTLDAAFRVSYN